MLLNQQLSEPLFVDRRGLDRRQTEINIKRRCYDRRSRTFNYHRTIHLSDTNMFGSVYFARFFDFQGEAREEFLQYFMGNDLLKFMQLKYGMVTVEAHCKYKGPLFLYDNLVVDLQVPKIKRAKFKLNFSTRNASTDIIVAEGEQWIGFTNAEGTPVAIPEIILKNLNKYQLL